MRGLARKNNLADLPDPLQARRNLGLADADYNRIRGLFTGPDQIAEYKAACLVVKENSHSPARSPLQYCDLLNHFVNLPKMV